MLQTSYKEQASTTIKNHLAPDVNSAETENPALEGFRSIPWKTGRFFRVSEGIQ